jgi:single-strand DNA-binding protein
MNVVILSGHLSSPPRCTQLPSGDERWALELSCAVDPGTISGGAALLSVPVAVASTVPGLDHWTAGTELVVAGVVRRRFYRAGGITQSRTEVLAGAVVPVTARRPLDRALATAVRSLGREQARRLRSVLPEQGAA